MATMTATISTHMGVQAAFEHNRRETEVVRKEAHIDPNGVYEVWLDRGLLEVYEEQFGEAIREYDASARPAQRVGSAAEYLQSVRERRAEADAYNEQVKKDNEAIKARNLASGKPKSEWEPLRRTKAAAAPVYEEIAGVYQQEGPPLSLDDKRAILKEYADGWAQRNPGMALVGVYFHADEPDAEPHVHIDYVPVGAGYQRGMAKQNCLERALRVQGFKSEGFKQTAQQQWEAAENSYLQELCEARGIDVLHPQRGKHSTHLTTDEKKRRTEEERSREDLLDLQSEVAAQKALLRASKADVEAARVEAGEIRKKASDALQEAQEAKRELLRTRTEMFSFLSTEYGDEAVVKYFDRFGNGAEQDAEIYNRAKAALDAAKADAKPATPAPAKSVAKPRSGMLTDADFAELVRAKMEKRKQEQDGMEL